MAEIKTLKDVVTGEQVLPRTKLKAISDDNGQAITVSAEDINKVVDKVDKSYVDEQVANLGETKQDKLTAGANIIIQDNVISASGGLAEVSWGGITGTLANQADLKAELDAKADKSELAKKQDELEAGEGINIIDNVISSNVAVPDKVSDLTNDSGFQTATEVQATVEGALEGYATEAWVGEQGYLTEHQDISNLATKEEVTNGLATKANIDDVYSKEEIDDKLRYFLDIPIRTNTGGIHTQQEILNDWFHVTSIQELKALCVSKRIFFVDFSIFTQTYRFPVEYFEISGNKVTLKFQGLNTRDDVVSKYVIEINLDETVFEGTDSNLRTTITSLETPELVAGENINIEGNKISATVPTKVSELENDSAYQTESQVSTLIADAVGDITGFEYSVVESLPQTGEKGIIYLVSNDHGEQDIYDEYIWVNNAFEKIGNTQLDLSSYATQEWVEGKGYAVKTTVDSQIAEVDNKFANYRTTAEQIEIDNTKANVADVYNKTEVDGKLDTKANVEDVYTKEIIDKRSEVIISGPTTFNGWGSKVYPCFTGQTPLFWLANGTAGGRGLQDVAELKYYVNNLNQFYVKQGISYSQGTYIYKFHVEYVQLEGNTLHLVYTGLDMNASAEDKFCKYVLDIHIDDTVFEGTNSNVKAEKFAIEDFLDVQTELTAGNNITIQDGTISANVPTNVSAFTNDAAYQNKNQVDEAINASIAKIATVQFTVVDELPESGESDTIYLLKTTNEPAIQTFALSDSVESYLQYIWDALNTQFQQIGTTDISLAGYATETYVDNRVSEAVADITQFDVVIPENGQLPLQGVKGTIYLVPSESGDGFYDEYLWVQNSFTKIGTTSINFSDYVTHEELTTELANKADKTQINAINAELALKANTSDLANYATTTALEAKQDKLVAGSNIRINDNVISATGEILNEVDFANITGDIATNPQLQEEFNKKVNEDDLIELTSEQVEDLWAGLS